MSGRRAIQAVDTAHVTALRLVQAATRVPANRQDQGAGMA